MRKLFTVLAILFLSASFASWIRMCDPLLGARTWGDLSGKPVKVWVGSTVFYPVFELLYTWPAYILGGLIFFGIARKWPDLGILSATVAGAAIGLVIYLLYAFVHAQWLLQTHSLVIKEVLIYTVSGAVFGFCYQRFLLRNYAAARPLTD